MKSPSSEMQARSLLEDLLAMQVGGYAGAAWGYNFDWQSRNFFAPKGTPTVVPTAFAARAFVEAAREFHDGEYLSIARSACDFIVNDFRASSFRLIKSALVIRRKGHANLQASLMGAEVLASVGGLMAKTIFFRWLKWPLVMRSTNSAPTVRGLMELIESRTGLIIFTLPLFSFH
jgi:hypothetical protein